MRIVREVKMSDYNIEINKLLKEMKNGDIKTEIWAKITNKETDETIKNRIWWEDENGYHDGVSDLPNEVRDAVDNAWIEKSRKW
jgi:hypothetical protein